jgi:hypothetical protein
MGFTIEDNVIDVDENGMKVNDTPCLLVGVAVLIEGQELEWKEAILRIRDMGKIKEYKVYLHKGLKIYLKPREKVKCALFEEVFGFGPKCYDYDENKIICIK